MPGEEEEEGGGGRETDRGVEEVEDRTNSSFNAKASRIDASD